VPAKTEHLPDFRIVSALMMSSNNFPVGLPLGDLSNFLETPKEKRIRQEAQPTT
jgi:hypothetical protein